MSSQKRVLVLGAGLVTPPLIHYLVETCNYHVTVANRTLQNAEKLVRGLKNASAIKLDVESATDLDLLDTVTSEHDAVVSMLPYLFHPVAAKVALKHKKHFFTTSYATDFMRSIDQQAKEAGIVIINECGVDPGTDHMSAMRIIDQAHAKGGTVTSFKSYCGGLPAPDSNDNPFGYKLSWAPRGVLLASRNNAHFLQDGKIVDIPGSELFANYIVEDTPIGKVEGYPNRDSVHYLDVYGLKGCQTIIRGTYRYPGWCDTIKKIGDLGYLDISPLSLEGRTYAQLTRDAIKTSEVGNLAHQVAEHLNLQPTSKIISNMEWLGLFSTALVPKGVNTYLDALCSLCKEKLLYAPGERDMLLMKHEFIIDYPDRTETVTSTLIDFGIPNGDTSMSRTVSLPVGIAVRLILDGHLKLTGLHFPTSADLYNPILNDLEAMGIKFVEKVEKVTPK